MRGRLFSSSLYPLCPGQGRVFSPDLRLRTDGVYEGIRRGHSYDQGLDLRVDRRAAPGRPAGTRGPVLAETAPRQRRTVSGATITSASLIPAHTLDSQAQKSRSVVRSFGRVTVRWYTPSCWRKARYSRARWRWPPRRNGRSRSWWSRRVIIELNCLRIGADRSTTYWPDGVLAKDSPARPCPLPFAPAPLRPPRRVRYAPDARDRSRRRCPGNPVTMRVPRMGAVT